MDTSESDTRIADSVTFPVVWCGVCGGALVRGAGSGSVVVDALCKNARELQKGEQLAFHRYADNAGATERIF